MISLKTQAVQLGASYRLPVHIIYRQIPGRLGGDSSFADSIIAKYKTAEDQELPSADFVFPKFGESDAGAALTELTNQLILMNRIRIQMNIRNYQIMQRYSLTVSSRCEQILNELDMRTNIYSGVSQESVRELRQIHRELSERVTVESSREALMQAPAIEPSVREEEESTLILRILTAASRGNGTRERYMRQLVNRMQSVGVTESQGRDTSASRTLLRKAETELFQLPERETGTSMTIWRSEAAKQFFWRIQRTPDPVRSLLLEAGGFSSLVTFEKVLKNMDTETFRSYAQPLMQRISDSFSEPVSYAGRGDTAGEYGDEEWLRLYHTVENAAAVSDAETSGLDVYHGLPGADGLAGRDGLRGADGLSGDSYRLFEQLSEEDWNLFRSELIHADQEGELKKQVPELYRALTEGRAQTESGSPSLERVSLDRVAESSPSSVVSGSALVGMESAVSGGTAAGAESAVSAGTAVGAESAVSGGTAAGAESGTGRQAPREVVENILNTMDSETFRTVVYPLFVRMTGGAFESGIAESFESSEDDERSLQYRTVERVFATLAEKTGVQPGTTGTAGREGLAGAAGLGGSAGQPGTAGAIGREGLAGAAGSGGNAGQPGTAGIAGREGLAGAAGSGGSAGQPGTAGTAGREGLAGAAGSGGSAGRPGTAGTAGREGLAGTAGLGGSAGQPGAAGIAGREGLAGAAGSGGSAGRPGTAGIAGREDLAGVAGSGGSAGQPGAAGIAGREGLAGAAGLGGSSGQAGTAGATGREGLAGAEGATGREGLAGAEGLGGSAGQPGTAGAAGREGLAGAAGLGGSAGQPGAAGIAGREGVSGAAGLGGSAGQPGSAGAAGREGLAGAEGLDGSIGQPGTAGAAGRDGTAGASGPEGRDGLMGTEGSDGREGLMGITGPGGRDGLMGAEGLSGQDSLTEYTEKLFERQSEATFELFCSELIYADREGTLKNQVPELYRALTEGRTSQGAVEQMTGGTIGDRTAAGAASRTDSGEMALAAAFGAGAPVTEAGRVLAGRTDGAGESGREGGAAGKAAGSTAGQGAVITTESAAAVEGFSPRTAAWNILRTMDRETFHTVVRPLLVRMTGDLSDIGTQEISSAASADGGRSLQYRTAEMVLAAFADRDEERPGAIGVYGRAGARGAEGTGGPSGMRGAEGTGGASGMRGAEGLGGPSGMRGADGTGGPSGMRGAEGTGGASGARGAKGLGGPSGARGAEGTDGASGARGAEGTGGASGMRGAEGIGGEAGARGAEGTDGASGVRGAEGIGGEAGARGAEGTDGASGARGAEGIGGRDGLQGIETLEYTDRLFEQQTEEVWELFCSELIYADQEGELKRQVPELYRALEEGRIEAERAADWSAAAEAGPFGTERSSSRVIVGNIIKTMDRETYNTVVRPLLREIAGPVYDSGLSAEGAASGFEDADRQMRYQTVEQVFAVLTERSGGHRGSEAFTEYLSQFFDQHTDEDWELFRSELIYADRDGELKKQLPELYQSFAKERTAEGEQIAGAVSGDEGGQTAGGTYEDHAGGRAAGSNEERRDTDVTGTAGTSGETRESIPAADRTKEILHEKETLFKILREERGTLRILRTLIIEAIRNIAVIRENQKEFMSLAESIMNLTSEQWYEFKHDVKVLHKEDLDIRELIPETILRETISEAKFRSLEENVHQTEEHLTQHELMQEGIRMSSEKLELLRTLQKETNRHDTVFTDAGRKLFLNTVLRESDAGRLIRPSFRELSSEGKETWRNFVTDLLHIDRHGQGGGPNAGTEYFGKLAEQYGLLIGGEGAGTETVTRRETAIHLLEQRRKERILDIQTIIEKQQEAERIRNTETQVFRLLTSRPQGFSPEEADVVSGPTPADMTVQRPAASREAAAQSSNAEAALRQAQRQLQTESHHDIEFETVRQTFSEQENSRELKEVSDVLKRHEQEITGLIRAQKAGEERNLPKEVIKKINDRMRMERLRGGH